MAISTKITSVTELLLACMRIESSSGNEGAFGSALSTWLNHHGWVTTLQPLDGEPTRKNLLAMRPGATTSDIRLVLNSHLDTVPPYIPPTMDADGSTIRGRGSCDAKGMIACMCMVANRLVMEENTIVEKIALLFVVGEEAGHQGMIKANAFNLRPEYMIVGEPTELKFAARQKGIINVHLSAKGKAAHSGYPHLGVNANEAMVDVLHDLLHTKWPEGAELGTTNMNIGLMKGGQAPNATAEESSAHLLFRVVTSPAQLFEQCLSVVAGRVDCRQGIGNSPVDLFTPPDQPTTIVSFNTDVPYFESPNTKSLLYGPGAITDAHSAWEHVKVDDLNKAMTVYYETIKKLLQ